MKLNRGVVFYIEFQPAHILPERSSSNLRIREFGSATLVCQAIGNPEPSITWSVKPFSEPLSGVTCGVVPFESGKYQK